MWMTQRLSQPWPKRSHHQPNLEPLRALLYEACMLMDPSA
uniref:Uncharacterized protein n=1 Tax=Anguilla anguilla TaxID=7936 RepID=A0A0E9XLC7_ANGAN